MNPILRKKKKGLFVEEQSVRVSEETCGLQIVLVDGKGKEPPSNEDSTRRASLREFGDEDHHFPKESRAQFQDRVEFRYINDTPLVHNSVQCAELGRQIRGRPSDLPGIDDLMFKDTYVNSEQVGQVVS